MTPARKKPKTRKWKATGVFTRSGNLKQVCMTDEAVEEVKFDTCGRAIVAPVTITLAPRRKPGARPPTGERE